MALHTKWVHVTEGEQEVLLYTARQELAKGPLPVVVVIQEIFAVDDHIVDVTNRFAEAGYYAIAPDLYAVNGERPAELTNERCDLIKDLLDRIPGEELHDREKIGAILAKESPELRETFGSIFAIAEKFQGYLNKIHAAIAYAQTAEESAGHRIATIGYCMGGALSARIA